MLALPQKNNAQGRKFRPCAFWFFKKTNFQTIFIGGHVPTMKIPLESKIAFESPFRHENAIFGDRVNPKEGCRSVAQPHRDEPLLCFLNRAG